MASHLVRRIAWGLVWRWSILFASLIAPAPPAAIVGVAVLLAGGLVAAMWRRQDLLGSAWRLLLAVTVVNLGFWLGSPLLVPVITVALVVTVADLWWSLAGRRIAGRPETAAVATDSGDAVLTRMAPVEPYRPTVPPDPVVWLQPDPIPVRVDDRRRRRASRGTAAAGLRLLVAACLLVTLFTVGAFTIASRAATGLTSALASASQSLDRITGAAPAASSPPPAASTTPPPAPTPNPATALAPNGGGEQQPANPAPGLDTSGVCVSLPDHRWEVRLPNGQVVIVTTRHRSGCPDLASILKALQNASGDSN